MSGRSAQARRTGSRKTVKVRRAAGTKRGTLGHWDVTVFFVVMLLVLFGVIMIFSASYYDTLTSHKYNYDMYYYLKKQVLWAVLGITAMVVMTNINYHILQGFAFLSYLFTNVCLMMVPFIGIEANGAKRWLGVGSFTFQPAEVAKISIIIYLAFYIVSHKNCLKTLGGFLKCVLILIIPVGLIAVCTRNLSSAIIVFGIGMIILFIASPKIWYFVVPLVPAGIGAAALVMMPAFAFRFERIKVWLDPFSDPRGAGFQVIQSLYAVASGGLFGMGLGQSRQKTYVPEAQNDIIFSIICEELGMVGAALVIFLFAVLIWRGVKIAMNSVDMFGCLVASGCVAMIGIQVVLNIAVVTNTIPNTGVQLPFISYGGTSLVFTMIAMGILLNISRYQKGKDL